MVFFFKVELDSNTLLQIEVRLIPVSQMVVRFQSYSGLIPVRYGQISVRYQSDISQIRIPKLGYPLPAGVDESEQPNL